MSAARSEHEVSEIIDGLSEQEVRPGSPSSPPFTPSSAPRKPREREEKRAGALAGVWRGFSVSLCFEWAVQPDTGESYGMNGLYMSQLAHIFWECSIHLETSP